MNLFTQLVDAAAHIEVAEPTPEHCSAGALPPEGNVARDDIRARVDGSKDTRVPFDLCTMSPPRAKILELLRPEDPGRDALEAIVRPVPRRGLVRPFDEDTKRFVQHALSSASSVTSASERLRAVPKVEGENQTKSKETSLADELREAEQDQLAGSNIRRELLREFRRRGGGIKEAMERERMGKLALSVEDDEEYEDNGLTAAARRLDQLLAESRTLHEELAGIHQDIQAQWVRASRCAAAARALRAESRALRYLDDVVALLRGDERAAVRVRAWPFALGGRQPGRNYVV